MSAKCWMVYLSMFFILTIFMQIGESSTSLFSSNDVNLIGTYQVDAVSSGSGFLGMAREAPSFFTELLSKIIMFNYSFLVGPLDLIQYALVVIFGGPVVIMVSFMFISAIYRALT